MCGIAGWIRYGDSRVTIEELTGILTALQVRGTQATGVAYKKRDSVSILKAPMRAVDFIQGDGFKKITKGMLESKWGLLHTRQATHGSPSDNKNNHPVVSETGLLIHNGVVYCPEQLPASGQTDSEQLLRHIEKHGWDILADIVGFMSFAYVDMAQANGFYLFSYQAPLVWAVDQERNIMFFCSTKDILMAGVKTKMKVSEVPKNRVFRVDHDKVTMFAKIKRKVVRYYYETPRVAGHSFEAPESPEIWPD